MTLKLSRRSMLLGTGALAIWGIAGCRKTGVGDAPGGAGNRIVDSYSLECAFKETTIDGKRVRLRAYSDQVPGPLITTAPGHRLEIALKNSLPMYNSTGWDGNHNVPHHLDTTNLHVHGLDVIPHLFAPIGTADPAAKMIAIHSGDSLKYTFDIPDDHPAGLFWYHPHHHGSTAVQAVTGMAGPIIVRGAIDEVPEIKAAREFTLAINDIGLFPNDEEKDLWSYEPKQNAIWQTFGTKVSGVNVTMYDPKTKEIVPKPELKTGFTTGGYPLRYYLLNGKPFFKEEHNAKTPTDPTTTQTPDAGLETITIRPGEVIRIRMLNACSDNLMPIVVEGHQMHLIALDGRNFEEVRTIAEYVSTDGDGQVLLAPANRAEFLIRGSETPGEYKVVQLAQKKQFLTSAGKTICKIVVTGEKMNPPMSLPTKLPRAERSYPLINDDEIKAKHIVEFEGNFPAKFNPYVGADFLLSGTPYDETVVTITVGVDEAHEWTLKVSGPHHGGTEGHPFHIHVNAFEVVSIGGVKQSPGTCMDTIWVNKDSDVVIRQRYKQWTGKSVYHCHILPHEDTGMMANFMIVKR